MGGSSISYDSGTVPLARASAALAVYRYDPTGTDFGSKFELLPNVRCLGIQKREGADPWSARFRYVFNDPLADASDPQRFEEVYPFSATGPRVIKQDDRLYVRAYREDGYSEVLFDGFVQAPQADLGAETETVSFTALGTPIREWDNPLFGALVRDADTPMTTDLDYQTDLPARFNPDGHPNAVPFDYWSGTAPATYPTFLGPFHPSNKINGVDVISWKLNTAIRYIVAIGNEEEDYLKIGDLTYLANLLRAAVAKSADDGVINMDDDTSLTWELIPVEDLDVTGSVWPEAVVRVIDPHGFGFKFQLADDKADSGSGAEFGEPKWSWIIYRKDTTSPTKLIYLQQAQNPLDPSQTNIGEIALSRDSKEIVNRIIIDAKPIAYESSFVLAPLFVVTAGDTGPTVLPTFIDGNPGFTGAARTKYREWGFDECGEGYWSFASHATVSSVPGDLAPLLNPDKTKPRPFSIRRRPGLLSLASLDDEGKPFQARLHVSLDYAGAQPGLWDGTGTWQEIMGGWKLLKDRLGFEVTIEDPNSWAIGEDASAGVIASNKLSLVDMCAAVVAPLVGKPPIFRLTCMIESDRDFDVRANKRPGSPTRFPITRRVDGRDRYKKTIISRYSMLATAPIGPTGTDEIAHDDTTDAQAYADQKRRAGECGTFAGSVTIPRLSTAYSIGDRVRKIVGRDVSLRTNAGGAAGESAIYPTIVGISWNFDGSQSTTLELSDHRAEPAHKQRKSEEDRA